jgi:hypothetical protein
MTTEKHNLPDAYFNVQQPDVDTIRVSRHDSERYGLEAIVYFGDDVNMHIRTVAKARELLAAAFEALRILDPDGAAEALDALIEPEPGLVIPPAGDAVARQKLLLPRCASPGCVLRAGHDGVGEDKDGNEAHAAACTECGAADKPLGDEGQCFDLVRCADRQAAKADAR